jgi:phosphoribosylglycinamide formyltransferase-1
MKIVTPLLIHAYENRMMNIHPSLLPAFPGLDVQKKALEWGVKVAGCTVHFVTPGVDEGPIIIQAAVPVLEQDTAETLAARILAEEHRIYPKAVQLYAEGRLRVEGRRVYVEGPPASPAGVVMNR